ncbi:MAG: MATE family efflux transporter [Firmicutes bacterium]|nr:MATE family efflux transporter [Bacillota bacterium]
MTQPTQDKRIYTLSQERPAKAVVKMGVPLTCGMLIMVLYNLTDTFFIGMLRDDYQLAAVNLAYPVMMITIAVSNMVGTGGSTLIARCLGAKDEEKANHTLTSAFLLTIVTGAVLAGIGLLLLGPIVHGLGAKANTTGYTEDYVRILLIGTIFTMGNYTFGQLLRGEGSAKYSILGMTAGTVINIALDPVFIFALGLQVRGAAIATVLGNAVGMGLTLWLYASGRTLLKPSRRLLKPDVEIVGEIYRVGVPAALETLLTSAAFIVMNNLAVTYGELTVAAMGIAQKIMSLGNYIYQGFAAGVQPIMGYNFGAKKYSRMLEILRAGLLIVSGTELVVMAVYGIFAPFLIGLFTGSPEVVDTGSRILRALMCILPFVGATSMCRMSFQAMGKPMYALGITIVRQLVLYIPLLFLMNHLFHFGGLIWAQPVTELVMMVVSVRLLVGMIRRLQRLDLQKLDRPGTERPQS